MQYVPGPGNVWQGVAVPDAAPVVPNPQLYCISPLMGFTDVDSKQNLFGSFASCVYRNDADGTFGFRTPVPPPTGTCRRRNGYSTRAFGPPGTCLRSFFRLGLLGEYMVEAFIVRIKIVCVYSGFPPHVVFWVGCYSARKNFHPPHPFFRGSWPLRPGWPVVSPPMKLKNWKLKI